MILVAFACTAFLAGCSGNPAKTPEKTPPVLVIAIDGLEWRVVLPLLAAGDLPVLEGLMQKGRFGRLETFEPTLSPLIWTSIATGKVPEKHGILDVLKTDPETGAVRLYSSGDRRTKAIWNILSEKGLKVHSIGWWKTFPVEVINGVMIPQLNILYSFDKTGLGRFRGGDWSADFPLAYPARFHERVMSVAFEADETMAMMAQNIFGRFPNPHSELGLYLVTRQGWVVAMDSMHYELAHQVLGRREPYDMMLVYFRGADVLGHEYWRFAYPDRYVDRPTGADLQNYAHMIDDYYRHLDRAIGAFMQTAGHEARVVLLSDHGMEATNTDASFTPEDPESQAMSMSTQPESMSGDHETAPDGFFLAAGAGIAASGLSRREIRALSYESLERVGSVYDVMPTLLALKGLPAARDMDGGIMREILDSAFLAGHELAVVPTYDTPEWLATRSEHVFSDEERESRIEELRSLGYIE